MTERPPGTKPQNPNDPPAPCWKEILQSAFRGGFAIDLRFEQILDRLERSA